MPVGYPSFKSVHIPRLASEEFIIGYTRNQDSFAVNSYTQAVPVEKRSDLYVRLDADNASRILSSGAEDFNWAPGADRPDGKWNLESFDFRGFTCKRKAYGFKLDTDTVNEAEYNIVNTETRAKAQQAMTARSLIATTLLTTSGNHSNTLASSNWSSKKWDAGTTANPYFLEGLLLMYKTIHLASQGSVSPADIVVVLNPDNARLISTSAEIRDYVKYLDNSKVNQQFFSGNPALVRNFGLPTEYMGFTLRVEDAVRNTAKKGGTQSKGYMWTSDVAVMLARPNGQEGEASSKIRLATCTIFEKENMNVEMFDSDDDARWNRVVKGSIVDDYDAVLTSPITACYTSGFMT